MIPPDAKSRQEAKARVLQGLALLRARFPLEQRLQESSPPVRASYTQVLAHWLHATPPAVSAIDTDMLAALVQLDAVVPEARGLGCYPFSTADTGIRVSLSSGTVSAMGAIDALAIARLTRARAHIDATCSACASSIAFDVEENGGFDHDQAEMARVVWQQTGDEVTSCGRGLCRSIRFLCCTCPVPVSAEYFTLPQAAAIGNAFFRFQSAMLAEHAGPSTVP